MRKEGGVGGVCAAFRAAQGRWRTWGSEAPAKKMARAEDLRAAGRKDKTRPGPNATRANTS